MIETERLILRQWRDEDYPIYAQLNADPELMRYFPEVMSREESDAQRVMIKAGMTNTGEDFNYPKIPAGHALERFCLYKITR